MKMAQTQEIVRPAEIEDPEYTEITEIQDELMYTIRDENQQLIQVQKQDVKIGQKYIVFPVIKGG